MSPIVKQFTQDFVAIDDVYSGERWCEIKGSIGVDRIERGKLIANALAFYLNHVRPCTKPGSNKVAGVLTDNGVTPLPQLTLPFPEA